jgi:2-(3-amino-3-carboxypropyl)histidine synthase
MTTATDSPKPTEPTASASASKPKRRFVGSKAGPRAGTSALPIANQIPEDILHDAALNAAISALPTNYSFELHKTIHHVRKNGAKMVALQMPEGLQMFACAIADIVERYVYGPLMWGPNVKLMRVQVHRRPDCNHGRRDVWCMLHR